MSGRISNRAARLLATGVMGLGALGVGVAIAPAASAADGCGQGYHLDEATCVLNAPGPGARFIPGRPGCWTNDVGDVRCFVGAAGA